jgi:hypothetical protein
MRARSSFPASRALLQAVPRSDDARVVRSSFAVDHRRDLGLNRGTYRPTARQCTLQDSMRRRKRFACHLSSREPELTFALNRLANADVQRLLTVKVQFAVHCARSRGHGRSGGCAWGRFAAGV